MPWRLLCVFALHAVRGRDVVLDYAPVCAASSSSPRSGTAPASPAPTRTSATASAATAPALRTPTATGAAAPGPMTPTASAAARQAATSSATTTRAAAAAMPPSRSGRAASGASAPRKCPLSHGARASCGLPGVPTPRPFLYLKKGGQEFGSS